MPVHSNPLAMQITRVAVALVVTWLTAVGSAQMRTMQVRNLTAGDREAAVREIAELLIDRYVNPEVGEKCASHIKSQFAAGAYDDLGDPTEFADRLTTDLRSVCHDRHLGVRLVMPGEISTETPTPEEERENREREIERMRRNNYGFQQLEILDGNVGYLDLRGFIPAEIAGDTAVAAMNFLANTDAVIIDLRQNGGGSPSMIQLISSYFFEEPTHLNSFYRRGQEQIDQTWTLPHVPGRKMFDTPVYVLTSNYTFSAAEEFTYNLKNLERATIVGETTGGGAHPIEMHVVNSQFTISVPYARAINPITKTNWEGTGVEPDIDVPADRALDAAHLDALKTIRDQAADADQLVSLDWAITGLEAKANPPALTVEQLKQYVGDYGPRHITLEDGELYYQRDDRPRFRLIPLTASTFALDGLDYFRMKFVRDNASGEVIRIIGTYNDGRTDESIRD